MFVKLRILSVGAINPIATHFIPSTSVHKVWERVGSRLRPRGTILCRCSEYDILLNSSDSIITPRILLRRRLDAHLIRIMKDEVKKGMTFLDVGANVGYYTLLGSTLVKNDGLVLAFEPDPENYAILQSNIAMNGGGNVITSPLALTSKTGISQLYINRINRGNNSLSERNVGINSEKIDINTTTIDEMLPSMGCSTLDFIKIDIEGYEPDALKGAEKTLSQFAPTIAMEFNPLMIMQSGINPWSFINDLLDRGYEIHKILPNGTGESLDATTLESDFNKGSYNFLDLLAKSK